MSVDEQRISEALNQYAEGVVMTTSDTDRMQRDLQSRLTRRRRRPGRLLVAAVVVLLVAAAVTGGLLWLRRPDPTVPVTPTPSGSLTGLWQDQNPANTNLIAIHADNTITEYISAQDVVEHLPNQPFSITYDSHRVQFDFTDSQGRPCRSVLAILAQSDGYLSQGAQTLTGPGCPAPTLPESTLVRLSPVSPATKDLIGTTQGPGQPVTDTVQINGVWLLEGTGVVLAVDEKALPSAYLLDDDGDIDTAPDAQGPITVQPDASITLKSSGCDTTLGRAEVRGTGTALSFTATVTADPCGRFAGHDVLTWVRVL